MLLPSITTLRSSPPRSGYHPSLPSTDASHLLLLNLYTLSPKIIIISLCNACAVATCCFQICCLEFTVASQSCSCWNLSGSTSAASTICMEGGAQWRKLEKANIELRLRRLWLRRMLHLQDYVCLMYICIAQMIYVCVCLWVKVANNSKGYYKFQEHEWIVPPKFILIGWERRAKLI